MIALPSCLSAALADPRPFACEPRRGEMIPPFQTENLKHERRSCLGARSLNSVLTLSPVRFRCHIGLTTR